MPASNNRWTTPQLDADVAVGRQGSKRSVCCHSHVQGDDASLQLYSSGYQHMGNRQCASGVMHLWVKACAHPLSCRCCPADESYLTTCCLQVILNSACIHAAHLLLHVGQEVGSSVLSQTMRIGPTCAPACNGRLHELRTSEPSLFLPAGYSHTTMHYNNAICTDQPQESCAIIQGHARGVHHQQSAAYIRMLPLQQSQPGL